MVGHRRDEMFIMFVIDRGVCRPCGRRACDEFIERWIGRGRESAVGAKGGGRMDSDIICVGEMPQRDRFIL